MNDDTLRQLDALNRRFYEAVAEAFSASRSHAWPGWGRVLEHLRRLDPTQETGAPLRVLDVGCGNGRFVRFLADHWGAPFDYIGLDSSAGLLGLARESCRGLPLARIDWVRGDAFGPDAGDSIPAGPFDLVVAFGLLHHVAGSDRRRELVERLLARARPGGLLALTVWRFADSERFARRIVPWHGFNETSPDPIDPAELEPGDHLLRFGEGPGPLRYCHHSAPEEVRALTAELDAISIDSFDEDGKTRDLNHYEVLRRPHPDGQG